MAEIQAKSVRSSEISGIVRHIITGAIICACVYLIFQGIRPILTREPNAIKAFASVVHELALSQFIWIIVSAGTTGGWWLERKGKKRALKEKAKLQAQLEGADSYRSSSENPI